MNGRTLIHVIQSQTLLRTSLPFSTASGLLLVPSCNKDVISCLSKFFVIVSVIVCILCLFLCYFFCPLSLFYISMNIFCHCFFFLHKFIVMYLSYHFLFIFLSMSSSISLYRTSIIVKDNKEKEEEEENWAEIHNNMAYILKPPLLVTELCRHAWSLACGGSSHSS